MNGNQDYSGDLPLILAGWGAGSLDLDGARDFWGVVKRFAEDSVLADGLDDAMAGESSPRVWLFLHEPGQSALSAATALAFARELAARDQAALVLDCDDESSSLTRWAGRGEEEGWIDLIRYGTSVLTCGQPLPFEGRRGYLLGVGSFTPTDVTVREMDQLVSRLRRQADDLLLVAPANDLGRQWTRVADIRLLCWDRAARSGDEIAETAGFLAGNGYPVTGLIGYGLPTDAEVAAAAPSADAEEVPAEPAAISAAPESTGSPSSGNAAAAGAETPEPAVGAEDWQDPIPVTPAAAEEQDPGYAGRTGNSGVFWGTAVISVVLIVIAAVYYLRNVRVPSGGQFGDVPTTAQADVGTGGGMNSELTTLEPASGEDESTDGRESSLPASSDPAGSEDELARVEREIENDAPETVGTLVRIENEQESPPTELIPGPASDAVQPDAGTETTETDSRSAADFDMAPYLQDVGTEGWAIWVYSFPDTNLAVREIARLQRRGFHASARAVEIKDKGRWYRIYIGSFPSKSAASAAKPALLEKLGEDWAAVARF